MHAIRLLRLLALALSFILSSAILAAQAFGPAFLDGLVRSLLSTRRVDLAPPAPRGKGKGKGGRGRGGRGKGRR